MAEKKKKISIRVKFMITITIGLIATFFNWKEIPIQDNYVVIIKTILYTICAGFSVKQIAGIFLNREV